MNEGTCKVRADASSAACASSSGSLTLRRCRPRCADVRPFPPVA
jgi:hypothetical protein